MSFKKNMFFRDAIKIRMLLASKKIKDSRE